MKEEIIYNILICGAFGSAVFTILLFAIAFTGIADAIRNEEGKFIKKLNYKSVAGFSLFITFLFGLLLWGNARLENMLDAELNLYVLWLNSFGIFMVIHLYDLLIIDYLIVIKWRPKFFNLPETAYYTQFKPHVDGFIRGIPFGILVSLIVAIITT